MNLLTSDRHLDSETLAAYMRHQLSDADAAVVEEHLADCAEGCVELAHALYLEIGAKRVKYIAKRLIALTPAASARALARAAQVPGNLEWRDRLVHWSAEFRGRAGAVVRVVSGAAAQASRFSTAGLERLREPTTLWSPLTLQAAGPHFGETLGRSPVSGPARGPSANAPGVSGTSATGARLRITAPRGSTKIFVWFDRQGVRRAPLVVVRQGEEIVDVQEPIRDAAGSYFAQLTPPPSGEYLVEIEPESPEQGKG